jgi:hypothetical protein
MGCYVFYDPLGTFSQKHVQTSIFPILALDLFSYDTQLQVKKVRGKNKIDSATV